MRRLDIALDVEGVLADTHAATAERSDRLTREQCPPPNWDFESEEQLQHFLHVSQNLWHNHHEQIPPVPQRNGWDIGWATMKLSKFHNVDILTSRTEVDEQMQQWLDSEGVHYDNFYATSGHTADKTEYGDYDVHIDDSPSVAQDALTDGRAVFLPRRPYNPSAAPTADVHAHLFYPVEDVTEACQLLTDPHWFANQKALAGPMAASKA